MGGFIHRRPYPKKLSIDILVEFGTPVGLLEFSQLQRRLESLLDRRVDLVTPDAVRPTMREQIFQEALDV